MAPATTALGFFLPVPHPDPLSSSLAAGPGTQKSLPCGPRPFQSSFSPHPILGNSAYYLFSYNVHKKKGHSNNHFFHSPSVYGFMVCLFAQGHTVGGVCVCVCARVVYLLVGLKALETAAMAVRGITSVLFQTLSLTCLQVTWEPGVETPWALTPATEGQVLNGVCTGKNERRC